ncbi:hypothetical protein Bb109J_c2850 [Bdellovibrio bacteriovorus]|uniref:hypothetical protein n=1 Tax=Bdellovibrio bacteriovorus TaxID=959 RepID=UPI00045C0884|nr:hypothetical protein [Bdellovibrio bacteriovorus]AHZ83460.1 hypothetical protein EP01_00660 [Bdellovibrio bacteriovorus]BEV69430.1 hypothetical protein Bb109J_c2850 [Bdellovibrio bacteriovorus]
MLKTLSAVILSAGLTLSLPALADGFAAVFKAKYLPKKLASVSPGKTTKAEVTKLLGKPLKTENKDTLLFYKTGSLDYDTTIEIKDGKVQSFYHRIPEGKVHLKDVQALLPENARKDESEVGHGEGTETQIEHDGVRLAVKNTKTSPIVSYFESAKQ